jgi:hypothetical protein
LPIKQPLYSVTNTLVAKTGHPLPDWIELDPNADDLIISPPAVDQDTVYYITIETTSEYVNYTTDIDLTIQNCEVAQ